ncbi:MAG: hypothetical protein B5M55_07095 [Desulfococcus sp. 4484_242]|nr:MAG: hypothetical protein B5M55_07095 [Desulfococcus sp. 4484_242]
MIQVTRLDNTQVVVNVEMIRSLSAAPDTVITFTTNDSMIVKEPVEEISKRILAYQRSIHCGVDHLFVESPVKDCGAAIP